MHRLQLLGGMTAGSSTPYEATLIRQLCARPSTRRAHPALDAVATLLQPRSQTVMRC